jgi:hypothetical protein
MTARVRPLWDFLACLMGPVIWSLHFFVVYGAETIVCLTDWHSTAAMRWPVVIATAAALLTIAAMILRYPPSVHAARDTTQGFLRTLAMSLAALSTAAIFATALSAFRLPACLSPAG